MTLPPAGARCSIRPSRRKPIAAAQRLPSGDARCRCEIAVVGTIPPRRLDVIEGTSSSAPPEPSIGAMNGVGT
jgi:hypothetical protein